MKKVVIANDHGGVEIASLLADYLTGKGYEVNWLGTRTQDSVDYPDMARKACREFKNGDYQFGILCCGTGIGISICANKIKGIRCALPQNCFAASMAKQHNNCNFIAFGGRISYPESPVDMLEAYISAEVSSEPRHRNRTAKLMALEQEQ